MSTKYYYTTKNHSLHLRFGESGAEAKFIGGKFQTDDPKLQKLLKDSYVVGKGLVIVSDSPQGGMASKVNVATGVSTTENTPQ